MSSELTLPAKAMKLHEIVQTFVDKHRISCADAIAQNDRIIEGAYDLIEDLCNVVGYYEYPEEDE